jgi:hypothetical protein
VENTARRHAHQQTRLVSTIRGPGLCRWRRACLHDVGSANGRCTRRVCGRCTEGPSSVNCRTGGRGTNRASLLSGLRVGHRVGRRLLLAGGPAGAYNRHRGSRTPTALRTARGPCVSQIRVHRASSCCMASPAHVPDKPSHPLSKRLGEPLAPTRIRPPYVRNHCRTAMSADRR